MEEAKTLDQRFDAHVRKMQCAPDFIIFKVVPSTLGVKITKVTTTFHIIHILSIYFEMSSRRRIVTYLAIFTRWQNRHESMLSSTQPLCVSIPFVHNLSSPFFVLRRSLGS